jgi:hypothetical protein
MQDEAQKTEQTATKTNSRRPKGGEILLLGMAWALFLFTLVAGIRIWSGPSH